MLSSTQPTRFAAARSPRHQSRAVASHAHAQLDRRQLLLAVALAPWVGAMPQAHARTEPPNKEADAATSPYIQGLLKKTAEMKEQRVKERLDAYNRKNFRDYFEFDAGTPGAARARGISPETQQKIRKWLEDNQ